MGYFSRYITWDKQSTRDLWPGSKCSILHSNCHKYLNHFFSLRIFLTFCLSCNMENTWPKILKLSFTRWHKFLTQSHLQKWRMMCIWHLLNKIWLLWSKGEFGSENRSSMSACHALKKSVPFKLPPFENNILYPLSNHTAQCDTTTYLSEIIRSIVCKTTYLIVSFRFYLYISNVLLSMYQRILSRFLLLTWVLLHAVPQIQMALEIMI